MLNWKDYYFIVEVPMTSKPLREGKSIIPVHFIIVNKYTGRNARNITFRTEMHALRSVKRLVQKIEMEAEKTLLGKESYEA